MDGTYGGTVARYRGMDTNVTAHVPSTIANVARGMMPRRRRVACRVDATAGASLTGGSTAGNSMPT
jgi:hypothetical protein